ncbi:hydantoinase B/oxoprolinase family protein (plasmid) [Arthrobacter sp. D3-18]
MTIQHETSIDDPITFSVITNRFRAIADEMAHVLERSAWTSILALARDFSCAIYDADARQIAIADGCPMQTASLSLVLEALKERYGSDINEGDLFIANDPYSGNVHIGDFVTMAPVFAGGRHLMWVLARGHQMDTGAATPSQADPSYTSVFQEGISIPPYRLIERAVFKEDFFSLYLSNLRYSESVEGDMRAMIGCTEKGRRALVQLFDDYSVDTVTDYANQLIAYSDRRMGEEIRSMPDGVYTAEAWLDDDGVNVRNIPIRVTVTIDDDTVTVDYTGSGPQAQGGVNATEATAQAAGTLPFLYYIDPDIPLNEGCLRHIKVIAPKGTVVNAEYPASTTCATFCPADLMQEVVNRALIQAMPDRVPAGGARSANLQQISGAEDWSGIPWGFLNLNNGGGQGASRGVDGWPLFYTMAGLGGMKIQPIEQLEMLFPVRIERNEVEQDSMGFGEWIGGPGNRFVITPLKGSFNCVTGGDGFANPPFGALGGTAGIGGGQYANNHRTNSRRYMSANAGVVIDGDSEVLVGVSTGGGGFGRPEHRDAEQVRKDVIDGIISWEVARDVFGVALTAEEIPVVEVEATAQLRRSLSERIVAPITPVEADSSTWRATDMRDGDVYLPNPSLF